MGDGALYDNIVGNDATAYGFGALETSTGSYNTAVGSAALTSSTTGTHNVAIGYEAGQQNTDGTSNVYIGSEAYLQGDGSNNVVIGFFAGKTLFGSNLYIFSGDGGLTTTNPNINDCIAFGRRTNLTQPNTLQADSFKIWCVGASFGSHKLTVSHGDIGIATADSTLRLPTGTKGIAVLSSGTATVSTAAISSDSQITLTQYDAAGTNLGSVYVAGQTNGTSFTIKSSNTLASDTVKWYIIKNN